MKAGWISSGFVRGSSARAALTAALVWAGAAAGAPKVSFVRASDGFTAPVHEVAPLDPAAAMKYRVVSFNPGRNRDQRSMLRLVNRTSSAASVVVDSVDEKAVRGGRVRVAVPPGESRTLGAMELERGGTGFDGELGVGSGQWRLEVWTDAPIEVLSLLATSNNHLANWSAAPGVFGGPARPAPPRVWVISPTRAWAQWVGSFESTDESFDVSVKYRKDDAWELFTGCVRFSDIRSRSQLVTTWISLGDPVEDGRVLQIRYRNRNAYCFTGDLSPGA